MSSMDSAHVDVQVVSNVRTYAILAVAVFFSLLTLYALFFAPATVIHELTHDGRHLFGAPCH